MNRDALIERLRKLKAKADSAAAIGSQEEAATFAAAVQRLLAEHKLSMSEIEVAQEDAVDPIDYVHLVPSAIGLDRHTTRRVMWREQLAAHVAHAHFCEMLVSSHPITKEQTIIIIGREADREAAAYTFAVLARTCVELSLAGYRKARKNQDQTEGFHEAFRWGFTQAIAARYKKEEDAIKEEAQSTGKALVRLDQTRAKVKEFAQQKMKSTQLPEVKRRRAANELAFVEGFEQGTEVELPGKAVKGSPTKRSFAGSRRALPEGT